MPARIERVVAHQQQPRTDTEKWNAPAYGVVQLEWWFPLKDGDSDAAVQEQALDEHPVDARHGGVHLQHQNSLAQPLRFFEEMVHSGEDPWQRDGQHHDGVKNEGQDEISVDADSRALESFEVEKYEKSDEERDQ